jgi:PAS domain S-box-containing protein
MDIANSTLFEAVFDQATSPISIIQANDPEFTILAVNKVYQLTTGRTAEELVGQSAFEVFKPRDDADKKQFEILIKGLRAAIAERKKVDLPVLTFEVPATAECAAYVTWWQIEVNPVLNNEGGVAYLACITRNITQQELNRLEVERSRQREQELHEEMATINEELVATNEELNASYEELAALNEKLGANNEELLQLNQLLKNSQLELKQLNEELERRVDSRTAQLLLAQSVNQRQQARLEDIVKNLPAGLAILSGRQMVLEMVNSVMLKLWDRDFSIMRMPLLDFMPELKTQVFPQILDDVFTTGTPFVSQDAAVELIIGGSLQTVYMDYSYTPLKNTLGEVESILVLATDVSERTLSRRREQDLIEELASSNEELAATNEELLTTNEELTDAQAHLQKTIVALAESKARYQELIIQAPVAIGALRGCDLTIEAANDKILEVWGKDKHIIGMKLIDALPELKGQPFLQLLEEVYTTGKPYYGNEVKAQLEHQGKLREIYFNFVYHPLKDTNGRTTTIMVVATDVTVQVTARKVLESAYEQTNLAKKAAHLGTFDHNIQTGAVDWDERTRELFGIYSSRPLSYEGDFLQGIHIADKEKVIAAISGAFNRSLSNGELDIQYRTIGAEDRKLRWVRAIGKVLFDERNQPARVIGSMLDVTHQVQSLKAIEQAEEKLRIAIDSAAMGTWSVDLKTDLLTLSDRARAIYGVGEDMELTLQDIMKTIMQSQRERVAMQIHTAIKTGERFENEYQIMPLDGSNPKWIKSTAKVYHDDEGIPLNITGTLRDITEQKENEQRKDDFISIASHELKTPVTSLKASLQLLNRMKDNPQPGALLQLIERSNKSMIKISGLIDDLLNVSQMNNGQLHLNKTRFSIAQLMNECCQDVRTAGKYRLIVEGDEELSVYADEHRIEQVITNFVNNAVKYAPESRDIQLQVERLGDMAKVSVKDFGPGIPPDKLEHIFGRYYRAEQSGPKYSGLGLGLYICSEIISRHGGNIGVESQLGKGSTFWFTVPLADFNEPLKQEAVLNQSMNS